MPRWPSSGSKDAKFEQLRKALMAAGLAQGGQVGQVVLEAPAGPAFRSPFH
jgi:hypothetical protein